ncbi:MAG: type I restriction endonuclease subunit R [Phycisphaerales bacterium]|nr:MAG: type I restriction endonuclease subunit R [Phycisphaerales bacterium]
MPTTDTSEGGLEALIVRDMVERGYTQGDPGNYDRQFCVDLAELAAFLEATQPEVAGALALHEDGATRRAFLARLAKEVEKRGVVDVLRKGIGHNAHTVSLYYGIPSEGNPTSTRQHAQNRFGVTRQLRYSTTDTGKALDLCLFINGLPLATFELKNSLTKQTTGDAVEQYKRDRDPKEPLFRLGRCAVHLAVDDAEVMMCTHLRGKASWFLPFNKGRSGGAGNPVNPDGLRTAYLWQDVLAPASLCDIVEHYAQVVEEKDKKTGKATRKQIFPRYHQLDAVRKLLGDARARGVGKRYLIQHSAGSGKSKTIAWLIHQMIGLRGADGKDIFDQIVMITDRVILDDQMAREIKQFAQVGSTVGHARGSEKLSDMIDAGKKVIVATVQTFPFVLQKLGDEHRGRKFAVVIDEAHSSQGGKTATALNKALGEAGEDAEADDAEDIVNAALEARMKSRKMMDNASYFAFTATPKNKTLEMFGDAYQRDDGNVGHKPFHAYTMKQAIGEGFILDVLKSYTPVKSYYKLIKTTEDDPEYDVTKAGKKLRRYVEGHDHAIRLKAEIMVDHFHEKVVATGKIGGKARVMVVCGSIERAIQYYHAISTYLTERKSGFKAIVAFSGEHLDPATGQKETEGSLNGFASSKIADKVREEPYRFLVCADKFQTGYDEPLLHTMYVDKPLSGIKAVQTLSRLNRAHPQKHDVFVLDFQNEAEAIQASFDAYYRTTILSEETDPNKLHDLQGDLDASGVYGPEHVDAVVENFLAGADRDAFEDVLDACRDVYTDRLNEDEQVKFKGDAKSFVRTYEFLASILPYRNKAWEKRSIFLTLLIPKLPSPKEEDLSKGILDAIDMDSYRAEKKAAMSVELTDEDAEIGAVPVAQGGNKPEAQLDRLSAILENFNEQFGTLFEDGDRILRHLTEEVRPAVQADQAYKNALANTPAAARREGERAVKEQVIATLKDGNAFYQQYTENPAFKRWVDDYALRPVSESGAAG